jgi:hypothetical protein
MCRLALICAGYSRRKWGETASRVAGERITVLRHARLRAASIPPPAKRWGHRARCLFPSPAKRWGGWRIVSAAKRCAGWGVVQRIPMPAASFARLGPHPTGLRPATLPTKNGGGIRNTVARPCRSNGSSSRGALATKQSMFPLRLDGSSLALAMTVQNKPRRRPLSLPPLRAGREKRQRVRRPASPPSRCPTFAGAISRTARGCNT